MDLRSRGIVLWRENHGAGQLCGYRAFVFAYAKRRFSHDMAAQILDLGATYSVIYIVQFFFVVKFCWY